MRTEFPAVVAAVEAEAERGLLRRHCDDLQAQLSQWRVERDAALAERDAVSEQLWRCKEEVDLLAAENASLRDTVQQLRAKQVHDDLPPMLMMIQRLAEQARELI